jgi:hypothetical protein
LIWTSLCQSAANIDPVSACNFGSDSVLMQFDGVGAAFQERESAPWPGNFVVPVLCQLGWLSKTRSVRKAGRLIMVRPTRSFGVCPSCGVVSQRVHSRYQRRVSDLPLAGRSVQLVIIARRFRCDAVLCGRQIFTERFDDGVIAPSARHTARLDCVAHHLWAGAWRPAHCWLCQATDAAGQQ